MTGIAGPFLCIPESLMRSLANSCAAFSARNALSSPMWQAQS